MDYFKSIRLRHWRQFADVDLDLDAEVCVLTGPNGCGKTTILNVLSRHFGWNINFVSTPFVSSKTKRKLYSDILDRTTGLLSEENSVRVGQIEYLDGRFCELLTPRESSPHYSLQYDGITNIPGLHIPSHRPITSYFPIRNIPTDPKTHQQHHQEFQSLLLQAYGSENVRNPGAVLKSSLISLAVFAGGNEYVEPNAEYKDLIDGFQKVLRAILPKEIGFKKLEIRQPDIVLITKSGDFSLDAMSGGVSSLFGMAWQIYMYGADKSECTVIIDEPENHLHPSMQRGLLVSLRDAFPDYRFIVSTHSPFIVSSDPGARVYGLVYNSRNRVRSELIDVADLSGTPNHILRDILDVPVTIPLWAEDRIKEVLRQSDTLPDNEEKAIHIFRELRNLGISDALSDFLIGSRGADD